MPYSHSSRTVQIHVHVHVHSLVPRFSPPTGNSFPVGGGSLGTTLTLTPVRALAHNKISDDAECGLLNFKPQ